MYSSDFGVILLLMILWSIGLIVLYSATSASDLPYSPFFLKQLCGIGIGILLSNFISLISYRDMLAWGQMAHYAVLFLLALTLLKGSSAMGAQRWIDLGFIKFQPSEITKLTLPLCITGYLFTNVEGKPKIRDWGMLLTVIGITFLLIRKQPDLGSALIVGGSGLLLLCIAGLPNRFIISFALAASLFAPLMWSNLHEYQKKRILVFFGGGSPHKERYQLEQSRIAVGSGGFFGKGFLRGTQKNLKFLPENRTDFIFAVLCEEYGFIGVSIVLGLYMLLLMTLFVQCNKIFDFYGHLLACGLILSFALSIVCNTGMVVGLLPIVGIPLPCMSYGVTNVWITCISLGIFNSVVSDIHE